MDKSIYVIFGAGKAGRELAAVFPAKISYFVDNDPQKWGTSVGGIPVNSPQQLLGETKDALRVFIASMYFNSIKEQLAGMGFQAGKHYFHIVPYSRFLKTPSLLDIINAQGEDAPADGGNAASIFGRLRMLFDIQEQLVAYQEERRVLMAVDDKKTHWATAGRLQRGLQELFKIQVLAVPGALFSEPTWEIQASQYRKQGYSRLIYIGENDEQAKKLGKCFTTCCRPDPDPAASDQKEWLDYLYQLTAKLGFAFKKVTAVVPNYRYEKYLLRRLRTIIDQQYPIYEIIFLDDVSNDGSVTLAEALLAGHYGLNRVIINKQNSGSAFKQWKKGIEATKGDYIWIAEADDYASPVMLASLMSSFALDEAVVMSFCDSLLVGATGEWEGFAADLRFACEQQGAVMRGGIYDGRIFAKEYLAFNNSIPNVSAAVFKKSAVKPTYLEKITTFKQFGDWYLYLQLATEGKLAYHPEPMNFFRRQAESVTVTLGNKEQADELALVVKEAAKLERE